MCELGLPTKCYWGGHQASGRLGGCLAQRRVSMPATARVPRGFCSRIQTYQRNVAMFRVPFSKPAPKVTAATGATTATKHHAWGIREVRFECHCYSPSGVHLVRCFGFRRIRPRMQQLRGAIQINFRGSNRLVLSRSSGTPGARGRGRVVYGKDYCSCCP